MLLARALKVAVNRNVKKIIGRGITVYISAG